MRKRRGFRRALVCLAPSAAALLLCAIAPAQAHHVMGGRTPETLLQGFLSGLGHPVIGIDHLAFIVVVGLVAGLARLQLASPAIFVAASALGVGLHVGGINIPAAELAVAASVLLTGVLIAIGGVIRQTAWLGIFAVAGLFHGYAYGESIAGAEPTPLVAYLAGLVVIQAALASAIALIARRSGAGALHLRLTGAAIAGVGLTVLLGQLVPA